MMGSEILERYLESLKTNCRNLQSAKKKLDELETKLKELKKDPKGNKNEIMRVESLIKNTNNEKRSIETKLEGDGKAMAAAMTDLGSHELTEEQMKFWKKFRDEVMAKWDMSGKDYACKILMDFKI